MPDRGLLERFRPAAAPGAAGRVGVPADTTDDAALVAVLASLAGVQEESERVREAGHSAARERLEAADVEAAALLTRARFDAAEQRAAAAAAAREAGERKGHRLLDEAVAEADALRVEGLRRVPALVAEVLDVLRGQLAGTTAEGARP